MASPSMSLRPQTTAQHQLPRDLLVGRMLAESQAMATYALSQGLRIPPRTLQTLHTLTAKLCGAAAPDSSKEQKPVFRPGVRPGAAGELGAVHAQLARIVVPATPGTLLLLSQSAEDRSFFKFLGPIPLVRQMMLVALLFLVSLMALSCLSVINPETIKQGFFDNQGAAQIAAQSFLLSASGLGACFAALFEANRYVSRGTYDPKYNAAYWARIVLGLIAGIMLAELVGQQLLGDVGAESTIAAGAFSKPLLAFAGGFSAKVVYQIMERFVAALQSVISGSAEEHLRRREQSLSAELQTKLAEERLALGWKVNQLRQQLGAGASESVAAALDSLVSDALDFDGEEDLSPVVAAPGAPQPGAPQPGPAA